MKKDLILFFGLIIAALDPSSSLYTIDIQRLDGTTINLGTFTGKKIIIIEFDVSNYDKTQLRLLDSFQLANKDVVVIATPAKDFGREVSVQSIKNIATDQKLSFIITQPVFVSRSAGKNQHPLFKWLTDVNENIHFNYDADHPGQTFIVDEKGDLYALLYKEAKGDLIKEAAAQKTN